MSEPAPRHPIEPRWPVAAAVLVALGLLSALPERVRLLPYGTAAILVVAVLVPIIGVGVSGGGARWLRAERVITLLFCVAVLLLSVSGLGYLVRTIVRQPDEITGLQLLASSVAVWLTNVLMFSLLYWQMDRGGPEVRVNHAGRMPDLLFPQESAPRRDVPRDWRPEFVDYLFLAYSTATAFSTTDVPPLTPRAKLLMMLESTISLVTMVVVASRAINVLGS